jgi:hypothetical protein
MLSLPTLLMNSDIVRIDWMFLLILVFVWKGHGVAFQIIENLI